MTVIKITVIHSTDYDQITMGIETLRNIVIITTDIFAVHIRFCWSAAVIGILVTFAFLGRWVSKGNHELRVLCLLFLAWVRFIYSRKNKTYETYKKDKNYNNYKT